MTRLCGPPQDCIVKKDMISPLGIYISMVLTIFRFNRGQDISPSQDIVLPTIVNRVTRGDERFVDFVDFMKILFYMLFLFIKTINIRLSSNLQISHHP